MFWGDEPVVGFVCDKILQLSAVINQAVYK